MNTNLTQVIERYIQQPAAMPPGLRRRIESAWGGDSVQLYALIDLDASMKFAAIWLVLGPHHAAIAREAGSGGDETIRIFPRAEIQRVREIPGLSCTTLVIEAEAGEPPLAVLRYTHRQRRAVGHLIFVLRQQVEGYTVEPREPDFAYAEAMAFPVREAQASVAENRLAIVWRLLSYLSPYRKRVVAGVIGAALMTLVSLVPPYLTGHLIDEVLRPFGDGKLPMEQARKIAWLVLAGLASVYVLREGFAWVRLRTMAVLGEEVARDLRTDLYAHIHRLSVSYFSSKQTGSVISRVSSDTDRIWDFIAFGVVEVSLSLLMILGLGAVLISLDWQLGLAMTLPVPLLLWLIYRNGRGMQRLFLRAWRKWSNLTDVLSDTIPGIRVVKAFDQSEHEKRRFGRRNATVTDEFFRIHRVWTSFWPGLMLMLHGMTLAVWALAIPRLIPASGAQSGLTTGVFVSFLLYVGMFTQPIETFGQLSRMLNRALSSAHRIFELLDTEPQQEQAVNTVRLEPVRGAVEFDNVTFGYDPVRHVLKGVSFAVEPGEMIGLVGSSGSGKTTIINLIARFYDATGGSIRIDGVEIGNLDLGHYRRQLGMVLQDPFLFHGTIVDNIRYGMPEASLEQVIAAARAANAHDFICRLAHGYDTVVGERGHTLSGGERQRVSIARAVLHNPRILILDEATSSVDTETEHKIQEALDRLVAGRTVIAIAHRLSTLTRASRLFVIKEGRLVERGTHAELLAIKDGVYRKLHEMQHELREMYAV